MRLTVVHGGVGVVRRSGRGAETVRARRVVGSTLLDG